MVSTEAMIVRLDGEDKSIFVKGLAFYERKDGYMVRMDYILSDSGARESVFMSREEYNDVGSSIVEQLRRHRDGREN